MNSGDEMREHVCFAAPLQKSTFYPDCTLSKLFSFPIIPGAPRLAIAICGARTLVKIFFRKFIIKS